MRDHRVHQYLRLLVVSGIAFAIDIYETLGIRSFGGFVLLAIFSDLGRLGDKDHALVVRK